MSEEENKILQCIEEYLKEYADDYQKIVVEGGMFGDSIEFTAGYRFMKELMGYIKKQDKEIERLNNIINEVADEILKELNENHHLSYGVALALRQKLISYKEIKGSDTNENS